jgi:hypothetical protein
MFDSLTAEMRKKLYFHQAAALDFAIGHLNRSTAACLIRMPTGTGKTGVIACLPSAGGRPKVQSARRRGDTACEDTCGRHTAAWKAQSPH